MKRKINFSISSTKYIKEKLHADATRCGFPSASEYLCELIKRGLPLTGDLEDRLQNIEKKLGSIEKSLHSNHRDFSGVLERMFKNLYMVYKAVSFILARTFLLHPGTTGREEVERTEEFFERKALEYEERFKGGEQ